MRAGEPCLKDAAVSQMFMCRVGMGDPLLPSAGFSKESSNLDFIKILNLENVDNLLFLTAL